MATQTEEPLNGTHTVTFKEDVGSPTSSSLEGMRCPDPAAHHKTKETTLQDQASAAALYSTGHAKTNPRDPLGPDGKLSSASAATSLKHAQAHDLPSFPVHGIDTKTSAGAAANLAAANTKSPEWWKPELSSAAGKAALLANDYKMDPLWKPEASAAGSKAALLAHRDSAKVNLWTPEASSHGHSAANIAMGKKAHAIPGSTEVQNNNSLLAATGAVASSGRRRAQSHPAPPPSYPDAGNSARNALSAATIAAHNPSLKSAKPPTTAPPVDSSRLGSPAMQAARIQHSKVSREMYTDRPPVALEVEEKKRQDALRASAISMAKKMYDVQQHHIDQAAGRTSHARTGATAAQSQKPYASDDNIKQQAMQYIGIQEAAQRLASERLAKMDTDQNAAYRSYYGYEKPGRSKLSIRRGRNRAASNPETADSDDDEFQSRRIRSQMSQLNKSLAEVDKKKQQQDRGYLLAAAQRKVQAQMLGIDKKIFDETGKMSPAMLEEWDAKARAKAAANSEVRMENHGRVHIGHGKYMDQSEIDAVAQARIQPTLDEITEKTEKRRAEEEEQRLEMEEKKRQERTEKERTAELKAEEKRGREIEKRAAKEEKEAEKDKRAEEKRLAKQEKRKSREVPKAGPVDPVAGTADGTASDEQPAEHESATPTSPSKVKSLFNKFRRRSKHSSATAESEKAGFVGGVALRSPESGKSSAPASPVPANPVPASPAPASLALASPALASPAVVAATHIPNDEQRFSDISSISSVSSRGRENERMMSRLSAISTGSGEFEEARDEFSEELTPPLTFAAKGKARVGSPGRSPGRGESRFREEGI